MKICIHKLNAKFTPFYFLVCFLTAPFLKPGLFNQIEWLDFIYNIWAIGAFLFTTWYVFNHKLFSKIFLALTLMEIYLIIITIVKNASLYDVAQNSFKILGLSMVCCLMVLNVSEFISAQLLCYEILIYANLISIIICPEGTLYAALFDAHNYLLGYYNNFGKWFYPAALIALIYMYLNKKKLRCILLFAAMWLSAFLTWTGGVLVALTLMIIALLFGYKWENILNYWSYWGVQIVFYFLVIQFKAYKYILLIVNSLGKGNSFLSRVKLWEWTIEKIKKSFFSGYGFWNETLRAKMSGAHWQVHAHNLILDILFVGGIIYLIIFIIIVIMAGRKLFNVKNKRLIFLVSIPFLGWSIQSTVEPFLSCALISMLIIVYSCKKIENKKQI